MSKHEIIQMNHGEGEFSYAQNSRPIPGKLFTNMIKPMIQNVIKYHLLRDITKQCKVLRVADLGCGMGSTPMAVIETVKESVDEVCKEFKGIEEVQIYMSDLPSNDFNTLFKDAAKLQELLKGDDAPLYFVMGAPGSFHGRLFPSNTLHFVHCSSALHWLSRVPRGVRNEEGVPMNKGCLLASETSTQDVLASYYGQFENDFTSFLNCRSKEIVSNGPMVLSFPGRESIKPCQLFLMAHLHEALACLVLEGSITEEKLDSFDMPLYFPCKEELEGIISKEGSFVIESFEVISYDATSEIKDNFVRAEAFTKFVRSVIESFISSHFGEQIWNVLHNVLHRVILKHLDRNDPFHTYINVMMLRKKLD